MAVNKSALDALNSLATGGSPGLDAYKQAQQKEATARTSALQGALGGNGAYDAAMKTQGEFSPQVAGSGFQDAGSLLPAANQYLSEAANRIASENYVSHLKDTAANRDKQLLGASEVYANQKRDALTGKLDAAYGNQGINALVEQRKALEARRAAQPTTAGSNAAAGLAMTSMPMAPGSEQALADTQALNAEMQANDAALRAAYGGYAQAAGTDTKGFDAALAAGNVTGGAGSGSVSDLVGFLNNDVEDNRKAAQAEGERGIQMGGQARLRELAPLFGYDPLEAEGMFAAGTGNDLARAGKAQGEKDYVAGNRSPDEQNAYEAQRLGFEPNVYAGLKTSTKMKPQEIENAVLGDDFKQMQASIDEFISAGGDKPDEKAKLKPGEKPPMTRTGLKGFRQFVAEKAQGLVHPDGKDFTAKEKTDFIDVVTSLNNGRLSRIYGQGEEE